MSKKTVLQKQYLHDIGQSQFLNNFEHSPPHPSYPNGLLQQADQNKENIQSSLDPFETHQQ